jgi:hypothetical protein
MGRLPHLKKEELNSSTKVLYQSRGFVKSQLWVSYEEKPVKEKEFKD